MSAYSTEDQEYLGLHQGRSVQQEEGGDCLPSPQLCLQDASSGVLHPDLGSQTQGRHRAAEVGPEKSQKDDQNAGALVL